MVRPGIGRLGIDLQELDSRVFRRPEQYREPLHHRGAVSVPVATSRSWAPGSPRCARPEPDMVVKNGGFWVQDATPRAAVFPYAQPVAGGTELHPQLGQGRHRRLQRDRRVLRGRSIRRDRGDLPAHIPRLVQALRGHAGGSAKAHSAAVYNVFNVHRHLISRRTLRSFRTQAMLTWCHAIVAA